MTFADDIEREAQNNEIEGVVIGAFGWGDIEDSPGEAYNEDNRGIPFEKRGVVLKWEEARGFLSYPYKTGFGAPDCHAITAWTKDTVIFVGTYDGSTWVQSIPRNPVVHNPMMVGGG